MKYIASILLVVSLLSCRQKPAQKLADESAPAATVKMEKLHPATTVHPGKKVYDQYCKVCHQQEGQGISGVFPPLTPNRFVRDKAQFIDLVLNGMKGEIELDGESYNGVMLPHKQLSDQQIADVISYVRSSFGNELEGVTKDEVEAARQN
ncbi:cytochrome c [Mangrovibacterium marinum]|uniref:Cytochrome c n=1 Tax=Mangrovibacterium marinum TaxID=1639118 RepID=A0A2T5C4I3_9BACT|nr:cytochrome c [Mangrovibacterium marinum]PTN09780.1 cytochrome c [Mangrovibacterium marinum]